MMEHMGSGSVGPLSANGVDFSNKTQAFEFLGAILDDDTLKVIGNDYARYFWYGIATAVAIGTIWNIIRQSTLRFRLAAAAKGVEHPSRPRHIVMRWIATATAVLREAALLQFTPSRKFTWFRIPPLGTILLILTHFTFVMVLEFANNDVAGAQFWQARGVRAGWLAVAQVPLLILLISKNNIVSLLTGVSHERLNILHRWTARITLFLVILHFGYQSYGWQRYGLMTLEWATDDCPPTGIAAFALLLWMNLSTLAPLRFWSYKIFVYQHIFTFFGFIIATMWHLPTTALTSRVYIYIPIGLYVVDRVIRTGSFTFLNTTSSLATLTALDGGVTKIRLTNKRLKRWRPGAYVLISIPKFGILESHPATIASSPQHGEVVLMLKSHRGFTKRIMAGANGSQTALISQGRKDEENGQVATYRAFIHGPYGGTQSDFAAFDSVALIAGSTGVTFTLAILEDLAHRAASSEKRLPLRHVHFIWCVKDVAWTNWCKEELSTAYKKLQQAGIDINMTIYVTCADAFTESDGLAKECGCACDKSLGPCCCVVVDDSDDEESDDDIQASSITSSTSDERPGLEKPIVVRRRTSPSLPPESICSGRPDVPAILTSMLEGAEGESAIGVCGPIGLGAEVRNAVVRLSDERAIHKGSGCQGVYLHVESFS